MKIAVMMRVMDQDTGLRFFTEGLLRNMLSMEGDIEYLLIYKEPRHYGMFADYENVTEVLAKCSNKLVWDQIIVPYKAWRAGADVIFNPKFSLPLISHCPTAMGLQEPAWWALPEHHTSLDIRYMKAMLPLYCRKSSHFFPWSNFILDENRKYLNLSLDNSTITYTAPLGSFGPVNDLERLEKFRKDYGLPDRYILSVTRVENLGNKSANFSGTKNVETTVKAYLEIKDKIPQELVIVGRRVREYLEYKGWKESDLEGIHFTGFVPHEDVASLYSAAELFVIPSYYEGCPTTLIEAMTCGCPIIASETGPCPEVSGGAGILADPYDPSDFARKIFQVANSVNLRASMKEKSLERAKFFNWERTARVTLDGLLSVTQSRDRKVGSFA